MIQTLNNILTTDELLFLNSLCNNFIETSQFSVKHKNNYYVRKILDLKTDLLDYQQRCKIELGNEYELEGMWINKINSATNKNDIFHKDNCDVSIITYLNEDFEGGEFQYTLNGNKLKIKPTINLSIMMDGTLEHRVLNVTNGERFSLVSFYTTIKKKEKTLI